METLELIKSMLADGDSVNDKYAKYGEYTVEFKVEHDTVVTLQINTGNRTALVRGSSSLPTRGWDKYVTAMNRALALVNALGYSTGA